MGLELETINGDVLRPTFTRLGDGLLAVFFLATWQETR